MENNFFVTPSPHIKRKDSTKVIMWAVFLALIPSGLVGIFIFGIKALSVIFWAILGAVFSELIVQCLTKQKITVLDGSAALTGLLLAYNLPSGVPFWIPLVGSIFSLLIGKMVFGGLGKNIFNPALVGRAFLMASWPRYVTRFTEPFSYDGITTATPLGILKEKLLTPNSQLPTYWDLFIGNRGGCIGEVCILALVLGAAYLLYKGYISWHTPFSFIGTLGIFSWIFMGKDLFSGDWLFYILSGGLILGAFFMATDYVTSPLTRKGQVIFGFGCGLLTFIIRKWGGYPEGVSYAILIMNAFTSIIDRYSKPRIYGKK